MRRCGSKYVVHITFTSNLHGCKVCMSVFEDKIKRCWAKHGILAGEFVEKHDKRFRKIVGKYSKGYDFDELYSDYVLYLIPVYISNYSKNESSYLSASEEKDKLLEWVCYCIQRRVSKHIVRYTPTSYQLKENNNDLVCQNGEKIGIESVEELSTRLTRYERYLVNTIVIEEFSVTEVADVVRHDRRTVQKELNKALAKLRVSYRYRY